MNQNQKPFWSTPADELLQQLQTATQGLSSSEAQQRLAYYGFNLLRPKKKLSSLTLLLSQFKSPIIIILIFASLLSAFLGDPTDTMIILIIVFISSFLGFWQEKGAANAMEKLLAMVQTKAAVLRDGEEKEINLEEVVPGDIVILNAGDSIPGDCLILESKDFHVDEAVLTGETFPIDKDAGVLPPETPLSQRINTLFMGTHAVSGTARALVVLTGKATEFGKISERLKLRPPETEFERGVRRFGYLLMEVTLLLVIAIFAINVYLARPILESFLFSLALAVGLTPQLLPAIISINLAHGAKTMARQKVIVKKLVSIENFGSMNVLCSDKTGTLTEGKVRLHSANDVDGKENEKVLLYAYLNAYFQRGYKNPIDEAICTYRQIDISGYQKLDEIPYDFIRKRLSILVSKDNKHLVITKGALKNVLEACSTAETLGGEIVPIDSVLEQIEQRFEEFSSQGFRMLGLACREPGPVEFITKDIEDNMTFLGFLVLFDPPKPGIAENIKQLENLGISLKVVTGDNHAVAATVSKQVGMDPSQILTGPEMRQMSSEALLKKVEEINVFAEVEPNQKERIISALRKAGNVVGYMGDGINDAPALHAADVGISVDSAVDVAKEAADIVLLEKDLGVLARGVSEGRTTFANTQKYVFMATSANFGNMFSMAGASLFMSFLPLLPKQILLINLMTDFPEMAIASDSVDMEMRERPRRWDINFIRKFMITFGLISSIFDYLTFGVLLFLLHANMEHFRTGWFMESVISAAVIVLVIRSRRPFFKSEPGQYLKAATLFVVIATLLLPFTPLAKIFGFSPIPFSFILALGIILLLYITTAEIAKHIFYERIKYK